MLRVRRENTLFIDGIVGILLACIQLPSAFLTGHLDPLIEWMILCTVVIVMPMVYWTPFVSEEKAEQLALAYIRARHAEARPIRDTT